MATGSTYRVCHCRAPKSRTLLGRACPKLRHRNHGIWCYRIELPATTTGRRRPRRRTGFTTETAAQSELDKVRALLGLADHDDRKTQTELGDLLEDAFTRKTPIPDYDTVRRRIRGGVPVNEQPTVEDWLTAWLPTRRDLSANSKRSYESHLRLYLIPLIGTIRLDRLQVKHVADMFDEIEALNERIATARASAEPAIRASVKGRRAVGAASMHRIRATLRKALNDAISQQHIIFNPAKHVDLPSGARPKPLVWNDARVARWEATGVVPSPVMVWTPQQTGRFLDHAADDPLYALYHLIAFRGLRRGEGCGLHWTELDLPNRTLAVRWQIIQLGWATILDDPKTDDSEAEVALSADDVEVLTTHKAVQESAAAALGTGWPDTGLVFTDPKGRQLHPANVTDHFHELVTEAGLPPIRLHDLRHGAATLALSAGVDMKIVQQMLRHSSITITADTYTTVLDDVARNAADATSRLVPRATAIRTVQEGGHDG